MSDDVAAAASPPQYPLMQHISAMHEETITPMTHLVYV